MSRWFVHVGPDHFYLRDGATGERCGLTFVDIDEAFEHAEVLNLGILDSAGGSVPASVRTAADQGMGSETSGQPGCDIPPGVGSLSNVSPDRPSSSARHAIVDS